jgi:hypothetical protein
MADKGKSSVKNLFTALGKVFSRNKPQEFETRNSIEQALSKTNRPSATPPIWEPNVLTDKGIGTGVFIDKSEGAHFHRYLERENVRHTRYALYDKMDSDLVASALDVYANEATQKNQNNVVIAVYSQSRYIQDELTEMLEVTGLNNHRAWNIIRDMCKYGDRFDSIKLDSKRGVTKLTCLDPRSVYRIEREGELQGYVQDMEVFRNQMSSTGGENPYIDLNVLVRPYLTGKKHSVTGDDEDNEDIVPFLKYEMAHFKLRGRGTYEPYGTSVLEAAIDVWKKLDLMLDSIIIYRLNRAPSRLVFYVDVGNNQGADIENIVKKQINAINKKEFFDPSGRVNERYQLLDMNANIFIPVGKNGAGSKVEGLQGAANMGDIEDMNYLNNRLFSALKVPKAFLGFEGDVNSKGTLSQQNVTFGKAIQNIQEDFLEAVKDLCIIHLAVKGISSEEELKSFDLVMTRPSYIEEKARIEVEQALLSLASSYQTMHFNTKWIAKNVLRKTDAEIVEMTAKDPLVAEAEMAAGGGGGGMPMGDMGGGDMGAVGAPIDPNAGAAPPDMSGGLDTSQMAPGSPSAAGSPAPIEASQPITQGRIYGGALLYENELSNIKTISKLRFPVEKVREYVTLFENSGITPIIMDSSTIDPVELFKD